MTNWLDKYEPGGTVAKTDATRVAAPTVKLTKKQLEQNKAINKQVMANTKKAEAKEVQDRKNRIAVSNAVQPYMWSSPKNFAVATSAIGDKLRVSQEPNVFDDYLNVPSMFGHLASGLGQVPLNVQQGNYKEAAMNVAAPVVAGAAEAIVSPIIGKATAAGTRAAIRGIDKNFTKVGKELARIEAEGIAKGLSPQQIKNWQMQQVGITSLQREGYVPGVSEVFSEYITPYSYDEPVKRILDIPRRIVAGEKNSKSLSDMTSDFIFDFQDKKLLSKPRYDAWRMYSGLPQEHGTFRLAETSPVNHPNYSAEQLSNLEHFSLNDERKLLTNLPNPHDMPYFEASELANRLPELKDKLSEIGELKSKSIDAVPSDFAYTNVMGGYNRRFFDGKMEYNDVWDLDLNGIKVDKYFGKPFLSHGQLDYSFQPAEDYLNKLIQIGENYSGTPENVFKAQEKFNLDRYLKNPSSINQLKQLNPSDLKVNKYENGGWLNKYDDGGDMNANHYTVSAPQGYLGDGTFNQGRNYSPAWGGQFDDGGELPNVTVKGKRQPVVVTNPNDPRLKAYSDSLRLYNMSKDTFNPKYYSDKNRGANWYNFNGSREDALNFEKRHNIDWNYDYYRSGKFPGKIQPISVKDWGEGMMAPVYKKPTQPVVYQKPEPTPQSVIDWMEGNGYAQDFVPEVPVQQSNTALGTPPSAPVPFTYTYGKPLFKGGPQTDYYTPIDENGNVVNTPEFKTSQYAMGGSMPGAVGFMYARTNDPAPSNGPYAKKTKASAQDGASMSYYQNGLDFKPKSISKNGSQLTKLDQLLNFTNYNDGQPGGWLEKYAEGGIIETDETSTETNQPQVAVPTSTRWLPQDPFDAQNAAKKPVVKKPVVKQTTLTPAKPQVNVTPNVQNKKELSFEQIPTADKKKVIIDNYSDKYDYIVEGNKTYYRVKGGKSWGDISDNKSAQKNLLQFIDKNNYWGGYGSGEKELLYPKAKPATKKPTTTTIPAQESHYLDDLTNGTKSVINNYIINPLENLTGSASKEVTKLRKSANALVDNTINSVKSGANKAIKSTDDLGQTIMNGVNRKLKMYTGIGDDDVEIVEPVSKIPKTIKEWYANSGGSSTVIEAKDQSGRQYKQQVLPTSSITFGVRNRDELKDINTEGMEITAFAPFASNKKLPDNKTVLAIDQAGKLHTGKYKDFKNKKGFRVSETFMNKIVDLPDNQYKSAGPDNPGYKHPVAKIIDDNGKLVNGSINVLVKDASKKNFYGSIQGGRVLFVDPTTKEQHLVSGSAQHIRDTFKQLKGNNKYLEAYTLDNGTYARGLSYKDGKLTKERLAAYDKENTSGGNGLYIITNTKPVNKYQESYVENMPNIRTEQSESFKKGHALKNEIKNIILHHTAYTDPELNDAQLHKQYMTPNNSSSHVVIEENGKRTIYASPEQVTFHAGESKWNNRSNVNDFGVGVEFQGDTNKKPLTQKQIESFVEYYTPIAKKYKLSLKDIITHQMIAPGRKPDITKKEYNRILGYMKSKNFK